MTGSSHTPARPVAQNYRYVFLTLPDYTMIALASAVDALRMANRVTRSEAYSWCLATLDGIPAVASNGLSMAPTVTLDTAGPADIVFVVGGVHVERAVTPALLAAVRRLAQKKVALGALCTGGYALAKAGLLDKYKAVIHWENISALREEFPRVEFSDQLFAIDRDRYTCTGGVAPLDLMLHIIRQHQGRDIVPLIAVACGFQSPPHFSKCYRNLFGHTPSAERQGSRMNALAVGAGLA